MSEVTVKQLAEVVGTPVDRLLQQLIEAGLGKGSAEDVVSDDEKMQLLDYLRQSHGKQAAVPSEAGRITLKRKSVSEIKLPGTPGRATGTRGPAGNKTVSVEVRQKRTYIKRGTNLDDVQQKNAAELAVEREELKKEAEEQRRDEEQARQVAAEEEHRKSEEQARLKVEQDKLNAEEKVRQQDEEQRRQVAKANEPPPPPAPAPAAPAPVAAPAVAPAAQLPPSPAEAKPGRSDKKAKKSRNDSGKRNGRYGREELHVNASKSGLRRKKNRHQSNARGGVERKHGFEKPTAPVLRDVKIRDGITVGEIAQQMAIKASELIKTLMGMGIMATINQVLDQDTAVLVVEEIGHNPVLIDAESYEKDLEFDVTQEGEPVPRPPIVTIMGHVDHGKTSLLDYIRRSKVTASEAGGITQHVGAYHVETDKGVISFLDTPGHAAFTAMRARGAQVTDIVILVVAADDGVMPQTIEAIQHAKAAQVPIIVAVNKIDKPEADPEKVKQELSKHEVIPEAWGGDAMFVNVSAMNGEGIDNLLDTILLQAEVSELMAVDTGPATGMIIESSLDKGRGPVATLMVQSGRLNLGDVILTGKEYGKVRAMFDESGQPVKSAGPSIPVVVLGLSGSPDAGDSVVAAIDERKAREVAEKRQDKYREHKLASQQATKMEDLFSNAANGGADTVLLSLKADVQGSVEALNEALTKLSTDEAKVNLIASSVGGISESDVNLAMASNAKMIAFNVRADSVARKLIAENGVDITYYSVIYDVIEDVTKQLTGMLKPEIREQFVGLAEVKDVFKSSKFGAVAGCLVIDGTVKRDLPIRVLRDNVVIYEGELESLRRFKDDVKDVKSGTECGIAVKNYNDVKSGDQIEVYEKIEMQRTL